MKSFLLLSLLCGALAVCGAEAVPVDAAVQEEVSEVSVPAEDMLKTEVVEVVSEPVAPQEAAVKAEAAGKSARAANPLSSAQPPTPIVQAVANTNCPSGWHQYNDACYLLMNLSYSWHNADAMCQSLGSNLASAHNLWEYSFMKQLTWRAGFLTAWIGGYRFQGVWKWDDGSPFDYTNWFYHTTSSSYDCVFLNSPESRGWSGERCHLLHPFICSTRFTHC